MPTHRVLFCAVLAVCGTPGAWAQVTIGRNFTGSSYLESFFTPPDSDGAVGPTHFVELINGRYAVYRKDTGARVQSMTLDSFWTVAGAAVADFAFDPRVLYDAASQRWFATSAEAGRSTNSAFLVAVSKTSDPTAGWTGFRIKADSDSREWADFPTFGLNRDGLYIISNMYPLTAGNVTVTVVILPKADLLLATPTVANRKTFENRPATDMGFTPVPAVDMENNPLPLPILSDYNTPSGLLKRSQIGGTIGSPLLGVTCCFISVEARPVPPDARQPTIGGAPKLPIATGDSRFSGSVIYRGGQLWAVQGVGGGALGRAQVRWLRLTAGTGAIINTGFISDPTLDYYFPSIAVNSRGDAVIGFTASGPALPASAYAVAGTLVAGVPTFGAPFVLKQGVDDYEIFDGSENRWGDYSATTIDPTDETHFWTIQEWVSADDIWSTQITEIIVGPPACYANCNGDTDPGSGKPKLDVLDFACFQNRFALGDPYVDCNADGQVNVLDFGCFQNKFALGCP